MIKLHDYQVECIETIHNHFKKSDKQIIQLPTGSGKTFIFLNFLKKYSKNGLIICPSLELQEQIYEWGCFFLGKDKVSKKFDKPRYPYQIITNSSLNFESTRKFIEKNDFEFVVLDEAHRAQSPTFVNFIKKFKHKNYKLLGVTATPERLDGKNLLNIFDKLTFSKNVLDMINKGYLADVIGTRITTNFDINKIHASTDFSQTELNSLNVLGRNEMIVKTFIEECKDKKTLIFCLNVQHAEYISREISKLGYNAAFIHGKMKYNKRQEILYDFKSGRIQVLTNCQLLTEGFDEPTIEALILARPTQSKSLYCQMIGRGLRKCKGKDFCYLYELTDNHHKICTFNVLAEKESQFQYAYEKGTKLTELVPIIQNINLDDILLEKSELNVFEYNFFPCTENQQNQLDELGYKNEYNEDLDIFEAAFLIFKHNLRKKYGYDKS